MLFQSPETIQLASFLVAIGLPSCPARIETDTFLPGLTILNGTILIDEARLLHPGDLLHEAGHLAVMTPSGRAHATSPIDADPGLEMAAIGWSWAALRHLALDPSVVFHKDGYNGASQSIIDNFSNGRAMGVPLLEWMGMTTARDFPGMTHWLRQTELE